MSDYLFFALIGSAAGAIIAAFGLGLLITHQGSGIVNFAYGAMATWAGFVYADLRRGAYPFPIPGLPERYHFDDDVGLWPALLLALATAAVVAVVVQVLVFMPLAHAPALASVVASIGLVIVITALIDQRFPDNAGLRVGPILPDGPIQFASDVIVPRDGLWLAGLALAAGAIAWATFKFSRAGLITRAAADNEQGAALLGYSPPIVATINVVVASVVGALFVILASPMIQLSSTVFTFGFLIPALGAAMVGRFRSVWPTVIAGLSIGVAQSLFTPMQGDFDWFPDYGAREGLPFIVIIVVMVVFGERLPDRAAVSSWRLPAVPPARLGVLSVGVPIVVGIVGIVAFGPLWRGAIMTTLIATVLALSFVILTGFGGQTSLAQMAFAGVAGFALSKIAMQWNVPFPIAPIFAALVAMVFGVAVGLPALRVRGTNLAIVTLAGGVAINEFIFKNPKYVGDVSTGGAKVPNPSLFGWDLGLILGDNPSRPVFGLLLLAITVVLALAVANLRSSGSGRRLLAARSNERAASAMGIDVGSAKIQAFAMSSFVAGLGGCMIAYRFGSVSDASFGTIASLTALAAAYLGGITCVSGAVTSGMLAMSGVVFFAMSQSNGRVGEWEALIGGVLLIAMAVLNPEGIAGGIRARFAARGSTT